MRPWKVTVAVEGVVDNFWKVTLEVAGSIKSLWGALYEKVDDQLTLEGKEWNNRVPAGSTLSSMGFCAAR